MNILIACEYSGVVREAFRAIGHNAISCDLLPSDDNSKYHYKGNVFDIIHDKWDMMIAHPPCTHLAVSGAAWFKYKVKEQADALNFVRALMEVSILKICIENPISVISSKIKKPSQIIQPWQHGHETTKATCLWLKNLPILTPSKIVSKGERKIYASGKSSPMWHAKSGGGAVKSVARHFKALQMQWLNNGDNLIQQHEHHRQNNAGT